MLEARRTPSGNYRQLWSAYNAAQTNEKELFLKLLSELCQGIEEPEQSAGRPRLPLRDMIFCMAFKVYSTRSARRFMSDLREARAKELVSLVPHFNSISNYMELEPLVPIVKRLIRASSGPLREIETRFAADSTGLSVPLRKRYYNRHKERFQMKRSYVKLHAMCGAQTHIITSAEVSAGDVADSPFFRGLVEETARDFEMSDVFADGAYTGNENRRCVLIWGAEPYIAFRSNNVLDGAPKSIIWKRMLEQFQDKESEFWKNYYTRNNIETTFSMMQRKFADRLRSKSFPAQVNEALCMVLCHNLCVIINSMYELGIEPDFYADTDVRHPANMISEQELLKVQERIAALTVKQPSLMEFLDNTQPDQIEGGDTDEVNSSLICIPKAKKKSRKNKENCEQLTLFS
ncbi:MAG: transposase [Pyrinomonadaceae bacterium]